MDPTATLIELRQAINGMDWEDVRTEDALRIVELFAALDAWITGGGFLPAAWAGVDPHRR